MQRAHIQPLILLATVVALPALAGEPGLQVRRELEGELVVAQISAPPLLDAPLRERLRSGLTNRIVLDAKLVPEGLGGPLFEVRRSVQIVYDLWEEHYLVEFEGAGPARTLRLASLDEVDQLLHQPQRIELGAARACEPGRRYRVDATLSVNPISKQVLERSREMISSAPGERGGSQSRSLFGSVARVFFNVEADHGARVLRGLSPYREVRGGSGAR